jgi:hypothetical protein
MSFYFQHHELRVAVDIGADLQHRRLAIATGQRHQVGLGHDVGNHDRFPRRFLDAEGDAHLLGERRVRIMMQDEVGHD